MGNEPWGTVDISSRRHRGRHTMPNLFLFFWPAINSCTCTVLKVAGPHGPTPTKNRAVFARLLARQLQREVGGGGGVRHESYEESYSSR